MHDHLIITLSKEGKQVVSKHDRCCATGINNPSASTSSPSSLLLMRHRVTIYRNNRPPDGCCLKNTIRANVSRQGSVHNDKLPASGERSGHKDISTPKKGNQAFREPRSSMFSASRTPYFNSKVGVERSSPQSLVSRSKSQRTTPMVLDFSK